MDQPLLFRPGRKEIFDQFKLRIKDAIKPEDDDFYLVKWLRARGYDLDKAEKMFRNDRAWRKENNIDSLIHLEPAEVLTKYYPGGHPGIAKNGCPIWMEMLPLVDQKGFYNSVTSKENLRYQIRKGDWLTRVACPEITKKLNKRVTRVTIIVDLEGLSLKHLWKPAVDILLEVLGIAEAHYPDMLNVAYAINEPRSISAKSSDGSTALETWHYYGRVFGAAPAIFPLAYSLVKPFLAEETRAKIKVMGRDYKEHLLKDIDADQLPVHWGGTATDPDGDPYCRSKICMGGTVPEKYYRKNMLEENNDLSKFTAVTVQKGSTLQLDFPVKVKNSLLSWNFYTDNSDIAFGIYRRTSSDPKQKTSDMEAILPSERVNSHVIPEAGRIQCETLGTYVVRFDNNYSWINSKKLYYLIEVVEPDALKEVTRLDSTNF